MLELCVSVLFGDLLRTIPEDSFSDNSEELLQRGKGGGRHIRDLGGVRAIKHTSWQKVTVSHEEQIVSVNDFSAFLSMGRCKNWGSQNFLLKISN